MKVTELERISLAMGARPERALHPAVRKGRFIFPFTISDNAITAADLSAEAACVDQSILDVAGLAAPAANPEAVIRVERMGVVLVESTETGPILASLMPELLMTHTPAGGGSVTRKLQLHPFIAGSLFAGVARATTDGTAHILAGRAKTYHVPTSPLVVRLDTDTWEIAPRVAVNSGANIAAYLFVDGVVHNSAGFVRRLAQCNTSEAAAELEDVARRDVSDIVFGDRSARDLPGIVRPNRY